jgi:two-component system, LytTR family, response regulator
MKLRALIVEDEPLARQVLRDYLADAGDLETVGEAADGLTAVRLIDELRPDLVFLDVRMPELSGLEVLERIRHKPAVVFTTAYDRFAVAAFEMEALDYLVKPFGRRRFQTTLQRVRRKLEGGPPAPSEPERVRSALSGRPLRRLFAREGDRILPIAVESIVRIEACDDYAQVHTAARSFLLHLSLTELEALLDPERFRRVHRSHILNLDHVALLEPHDDRRLVIRLKDGSRVVASRAASHRLRELIR